MAANSQTLIRAIIGIAKRIGDRCGKTPQQVLEAVQDAVFSNDIANGKVLISTNEAGGTSTFALPQDRSQDELLVLLQRAVDSLNGVREVRRLRASFRRAIIS
jgi:hypothetical protein